nr:16S rRNA (uracil(1498)-N(3))-methyltransferase [Rhodococcus sp. HNM0569]
MFYLDPLPAAGEHAVLDGPEGRHAATVRRIGPGERLVLADGHGAVAFGEVVDAGKDRLELRVDAVEDVPAAQPAVTIVQALPKADRSELSVELATEAGADAFVPWQASRCVAKWEGPKVAKGLTRWRNAVLAAAKQSRRPLIPPVADPHRTPQVCALVRDVVGRGGVAAVLHEDATVPLASLPLGDAREVVLVVGPEGGVDPSELERLTDAGAVPIVLGPQVLRTSTAAAVALAAIGVLTERWATPPLRE